MKKIVDKPLGQVLIDSKMIEQKHLDEALKKQAEKGGLIGQVLVGLGYTTEAAIAQALATQYGFPYLPLSGYQIDTKISMMVTETIARQYGLVAIDKVGEVLTVAMSDPLDQKAVQEVEMLTKLKVQAYVCTATDVNNVLAKIYKVG